MLVQLPFFIGIGFCFGLLQQRGVALLYIALRWGNGWRVFLAQMFFLGLATLAGLALIKALDGPGLGAGLQFAGLVVGWAGGCCAPAGKETEIRPDRQTRTAVRRFGLSKFMKTRFLSTWRKANGRIYRPPRFFSASLRACVESYILPELSSPLNVKPSHNL